MIWTLKLKQTVEDRHHTETFLEKWKSKEEELMIYFHKVIASVPASLGPSSTFEIARTIPHVFSSSVTHCEDSEYEHLYDDLLPFNE